MPWALLRHPLLTVDMSLLQAVAMFGTIVAHEMAHAALPTHGEDWGQFVHGAGLGPTIAACGAADDPAHSREISADALGLLWAWRVCAPYAGSDPRGFDRFLRFWASRWRGLQPDGAAGAHLDRHPAARVRCDVAPRYLTQLHPEIAGRPSGSAESGVLAAPRRGLTSGAST